MQREYIIQHSYRIEIDEAAIDDHLEEYPYESDEDQVEMRQRFHRMFRALTQNPKALDMILSYEVLNEHDHLDCGFQYFVKTYFKDGFNFADILTQFQECLAHEDYVWWSELVEEQQVAKEKYETYLREKIAQSIAAGKLPKCWTIEDSWDDDEATEQAGWFHLAAQVDALEEAFQVTITPSGIDVRER